MLCHYRGSESVQVFYFIKGEDYFGGLVFAYVLFLSLSFFFVISKKHVTLKFYFKLLKSESLFFSLDPTLYTKSLCHQVLSSV